MPSALKALIRSQPRHYKMSSAVSVFTVEHRGTWRQFCRVTPGAKASENKSVFRYLLSCYSWYHLEYTMPACIM